MDFDKKTFPNFWILGEKSSFLLSGQGGLPLPNPLSGPTNKKNINNVCLPLGLTSILGNSTFRRAFPDCSLSSFSRTCTQTVEIIHNGSDEKGFSGHAECLSHFV